MKFFVRRTSLGFSNDPEDEDYISPLPGIAKVERYTHVEEINVSHPSKMYNGGKDWYLKGTNHRVVDGHILRDFPDLGCGWVIEVEDLNSLLKLCAEQGSLILKPKAKHQPYQEIEIYDGYRE